MQANNIMTLSEMREEILARYKRYIVQERKGLIYKGFENELAGRIDRALECFPADYVEFTGQDGKLWHRMFMSHIGGATPDKAMGLVYDLCEDGRLSIRLAHGFLGEENVYRVRLEQSKVLAGEHVSDVHYYVPNLFQAFRIDDSRQTATNMASIVMRRGKFPKWYKRSRRSWHVDPVRDGIRSGRPDKNWKDRARKELADVIRPVIHERRRQIRDKFFSHLPKDVLKTMLNTRALNITNYNWLVADGDAEKRSRRIQAVELYPVLLPWLTDEEDRGEVTRAIDARQKLHHALRDYFNRNAEKDDAPLQRPAVRLLSRLKYGRDIPMNVSRKYGWLLGVAQNLPPKNQPSTPQDWEELKKLSIKIKNLADSLKIPLHKVTEQIGEHDARLAKLLLNDKKDIARDARDWQRKMVHAVVTPHVYPAIVRLGLADNLKQAMSWVPHTMIGEVCRDAACVIGGGASIYKQLKASELWHDRLNEFDAKLSTLGLDQIPEEPKWLPLTRPYTSSEEGITITPLTSLGALKRQGQEQRHCIGGYAGDCLNKTHAFDLRDPEGRVSTGHVTEQQVWDEDQQEHKRKVVFGDLRGYNNVDPPPSHLRSFNNYIDAVNAGEEFEPNWPAIDAVRAEQIEILKAYGVIISFGYNPLREDAGPETFKIAQPFMAGGNLQKITYEQWLEKMDVQRRVENAILDNTELVNLLWEKQEQHAASLAEDDIATTRLVRYGINHLSQQQQQVVFA